jgi:hypothetical protein
LKRVDSVPKGCTSFYTIGMARVTLDLDLEELYTFALDQSKYPRLKAGSKIIKVGDKCPAG